MTNRTHICLHLQRCTTFNQHCSNFCVTTEAWPEQSSSSMLEGEWEQVSINTHYSNQSTLTSISCSSRLIPDSLTKWLIKEKSPSNASPKATALNYTHHNSHNHFAYGTSSTRLTSVAASPSIPRLSRQTSINLSMSPSSQASMNSSVYVSMCSYCSLVTLALNNYILVAWNEMIFISVYANMSNVV